MNKVPKNELDFRLQKFTESMDIGHPEWEVCIITGGVNMYYFTGTMCDGVFIINRTGNAILWVRRSYERAKIESEFEDTRPMKSFREIAETVSNPPKIVYIDKANVTLEWYELFNKYMQFNDTKAIDKEILYTRSVKSDYEISIMKQAGTVTDRLYREELPKLIYLGMSEADLGAELFALFIKNGFQGVSRFTMRNVDSVLGHVSFGSGSLYPSAFNGASGTKGLTPAAPVLGSHDRHLKKGDLIYIDLGVGIDGYHIDKTTVFSYMIPQPDHIRETHEHCLELEQKTIGILTPGTIPASIYEEITASVNPKYTHTFMGAEGRTVPFIGHGVGLNVDEMPVLAKGFTTPLEKNMTIAIEPKISIPDKGMVGSENTYLVTETGGLSLTGPPGKLKVIGS